MLELRKLFASMVASQRSSVDPSQALIALAISSPMVCKGHQDCSEFLNILLDLLEKASKATEEENWIKKLFYGEVKISGWNQGRDFKKIEEFCQWKLPVSKCRDLHESLNASTAPENIDTLSESNRVNDAGMQSATASNNAGQECWFSKLPPVSIGTVL